ncbi:MAG: hypothetical protein IPJ65_00585 [Archangiaceae bacterium]|nr:hypothetical protein [Archangiaceae bacterium]
MLLLLCTPAFAEKTRVTLVSTGDDARAEVFQASLAELLARLQLTLDVRGLTDGGAPAGEALAAVDADFTEAEAIKLTVIDDLGRTVMVRRLTRPGASPQLQAEAAAHVVQSVMEELITASRWKPPAVDPPPLAQPPLEEAPHEALAAKAPTPEPKKPAGRFGIDFAPYFNARSFLNGAPIVPGGGVAAAFALKLGRFRPTLTVLGDYHAPFSHGDAQISLKIETVSLRALATLDVLGSDAFRIDVALGGGADLFSSAPSSGQLPQSRLGGHRTDADPVLTAAVLGHLAIFASVDIFLGVTVDFDTWPVRYVARTPLGPEKLYQPYFIRPAVMLGFTFNSLGPDPYSRGGS